MNRKNFTPLTLALLLWSLSPVAHAQTLPWKFQNVTLASFGPGCSQSSAGPSHPLTGSFTVDTATGVPISWDITGLTHYVSATGSVSTNLGLAQPLYIFLTGEGIGPGGAQTWAYILGVRVPAPLPGGGGTVDLLTGAFGTTEVCGTACVVSECYETVSGDLTSSSGFTAALDDGVGGTSFQPRPSITSNRAGAAEPNQCNVQTLRVRCLDQNQSPVANCNISLQLAPDTTDVGGHVQPYHTISHPSGNIVVSTAGALPPDPNNCPAVGSNSGQYSFTTPAGPGADQGTALLLYYAPEASGSVVISGTASANGNSASIGPVSIQVQVPNLQQLSAIPDVLQLTGQLNVQATNEHPGNHYGQASFIKTLSDVATQYDMGIRQPNALAYPFAANDESLVEGGIFDLDGSYDHASGHALHRLGVSADVGSGLGVPFQTAVPPSVRTMLYQLVHVTFGLQVVDEGIGCYPIATPATTCTHWHLQY
jgi:hypothetical protein